MRFSYHIGALAPLMSIIVADQLVIPQNDRLASAAVSLAYSEIHATRPTSNDTTLAPNTAITPHVDAAEAAAYWYEGITHQGISAFGASGYVVYRNVKDYGALGDGSTDDTAAINKAIIDGGRCGQGCSSSTTTPAVIYFPAGTYVISSPINPAYFTQLIGNPNDVPIIKASASFPDSQGLALIDADPYYTQYPNWVTTTLFYRQIRNFVIDTTNIPATTFINGIHWPTAQATSIQNVVFEMSAASGTLHVGLFCESGSAGFLSDLTFNGGNIGANVGNQQFTMRGLTFNNCVTAISHSWDWSWTYIGLVINNCGTGIDISAGGAGSQEIGNIIVIDSTISGTTTGVKTAYDSTSSTGYTNGSIILENIVLDSVGTAVEGPSGSLLAGGSTTIAGWGQGHEYSPSGPTAFQGSITPNTRPSSLLNGANYYQMSKPQFETLTTAQVLSVMSSGAKGDGTTDDTSAVQSALNTAASAGQLCFFDAGTYLVTSTITIPPGSKIAGESYSVIMSSGDFFNDISNPQPVVQVGASGSSGSVQWTDMVVATQGIQAGATLIEWNLAASSGSGIWDVHTRIGGFAGSNLQASQCPTTSTTCLGAYMSMHVTTGASGVYLENVWLWTADHDIDSSANTQISIYTGRGLLIESTNGPVWLVGTGVEHHSLYQYQFSNTENIFAAQLQTETPYYQPSASSMPYPVVPELNDPDFATSCASSTTGNCEMAWGLRILDSSNIMDYGSDHYSFFSAYSTACSTDPATGSAGPQNCQNSIVSLEGTNGAVNIYGLSTVGALSMLDVAGTPEVPFGVNKNVFNNLVSMYRSGSELNQCR
ncbi:Glucan 1,3-beta-glucosidase [Lachnellula hyalina]|uniref:Glucan 1,3-beta-glucosidase n=1 Tax=Lachnellula hyalina TaxID=1316788 RepID=A0A8H8R0V4_9HELO|nr:Glucan 1,3-beta-glucosidase [Lachnellula hyalina]TVY25611.1 Glucan 1,3-beta-glucosidase [Lachnellula hyalina]